MRYLILISVLIGSVTASAASMDRNSLESIAKRLDRLDPQVKQLDLLPSLDAKRRSQDISLRLRRLENRVAVLQAEDSTKHPLNVRIQEMFKKLRDKDLIGEKKISKPTGNGVIKGRIRDAQSGKPVKFEYLEVDIYDSEGHFVNYGYADAVGRYEVTRLPGGTYYAATYGVQETTDYVDQLYENIACYDSRCNIFNGKPIEVNLGQIITGINFNLVHGAHITGHVVDASTIKPLFDQEINIYDSSGNLGLYSYAYTDDNGFFDTGGYSTGQYYAATYNIAQQGSTYIDELYSNITCWALQCNVVSGSPIQVTTGQTTSDIDFSLDEGGRFRGQIIDVNTSLPIGGISVELHDSTGKQFDAYRTDGDGYYEIPGLATGNYFAAAEDRDDCYHNKIYDDIPCPNEECNIIDGTPIAVTTGQMTSGVNFVLAPFDHITGRITDAESYTPLMNVFLILYDSSGSARRGSYTDSNGVYHIGPTDSGTYFLRTFHAWQHMDILYDGISCFDQPCIPTDGTPIVVNEGSVTSGIDFSLEPCLYCVDFQFYSENWTILKPLWQVIDGDMIGSATSSKAVTIAPPSFSGCSTCSVSATMKTEGGPANALYLLGWYENNRNTIELIMKQETGKWVLRQHLNGAIVASSSANFEIQPNLFYNVEITYNGTNLDLNIDGTSVLSLKPVGNLFGTVGFKVKNTTGHFGAVVVKKIQDLGGLGVKKD